MKFRYAALPLLGALLFSVAAFAQTSSLEGEVKGEDGQGLKGALITIDRKDIKGHYQVKTDKKGHYFHAGLPLGTYRVAVQVDGKERDFVDNVRTSLGDPKDINFDLQQMKQRQVAQQKAMESGTLTKEQAREMTPEQRAAFEKQMKEREAALKKNKALNDAFNEGKQAAEAKNWDAAVAAFTKASEMDPNQHVVWANLADALSNQAKAKTGAEHEATLQKAFEAYGKAIQLKPDEAAYHNNYAIALAGDKKIAEAQAELTKAAQIEPTAAGKYFYNLGAVLVNTGQNDAAGDAFKKAIDADPTYADAQYQYGLYLVGKAQVDAASGKVTPVPGTIDALEAYLKLKPDGPYAQSAKDMLATLSGGVQTRYANPSAPKKGRKK